MSSLPHGVLSNADIARIINSDEVQSVLNPTVRSTVRPRQKKNPLKNLNVLLKLNPYAQAEKRAAALSDKRVRDRLAAANAKRGVAKKAPAKAKAAAKPAAGKAAAAPKDTKKAAPKTSTK